MLCSWGRASSRAWMMMVAAADGGSFTSCSAFTYSASGVLVFVVCSEDAMVMLRSF